MAKEELNYEKMVSLIASKEWLQWIKFQSKRARDFQLKVNKHLRAGEYQDARAKLAVLDDIEKQINTFENKLNLRKNRGGE